MNILWENIANAVRHQL